MSGISDTILILRQVGTLIKLTTENRFDGAVYKHQWRTWIYEANTKGRGGFASREQYGSGHSVSAAIIFDVSPSAKALSKDI